MPFKKGRKKTGGKKKGSQNHLTTSMKAVLSEAFETLGGVKRLVEWGNENYSEFSKLWIKMLPTEIKTPDGEALLLKVIDMRDGNDSDESAKG
jgi:hypothetical protein